MLTRSETNSSHLKYVAIWQIKGEYDQCAVIHDKITLRTIESFINMGIMSMRVAVTRLRSVVATLVFVPSKRRSQKVKQRMYSLCGHFNNTSTLLIFFASLNKRTIIVILYRCFLNDIFRYMSSDQTRDSNNNWFQRIIKHNKKMNINMTFCSIIFYYSKDIVVHCLFP